MTDLLPLNELFARIGYALFHSLWSVTIVVVLFLVIIRFVRMSAAAKHRMAMTAQVLSLMIVIAFFYQSGNEGPAVSEVHDPVTAIGEVSEGMVNPAEKAGGNTPSSFFQTFLFPGPVLSSGIVGMCWITGLILTALFRLVSYSRSVTLRKTGLVAVTDYWADRMQQLVSGMGLSDKVELHRSEIVRSPVLIGFLKPVILVPLGFFGELSPAEAESILLHELAHIRRNDYLAMLVQQAVNMVLFYHPAVWLLSRIIDQERENACDDEVLLMTGDATTYARALGTMQLNYSKTQNKMAMNLLNDKNSVLSRLKRLVGEDSPEKMSPKLLILPLMVIVSGFLLAFAPSDNGPEIRNDGYGSQGFIDLSDTSVVEEVKVREEDSREKETLKGKKSKPKKKNGKLINDDGAVIVEIREESLTEEPLYVITEEIELEEREVPVAKPHKITGKVIVEEPMEVIVEEVEEEVEREVEEIVEIEEPVEIVDKQQSEEQLRNIMEKAEKELLLEYDTVPHDASERARLRKQLLEEFSRKLAEMERREAELHLEKSRKNRAMTKKRVLEEGRASIERAQRALERAEIEHRKAEELRSKALQLKARASYFDHSDRIGYKALFTVVEYDKLKISQGDKLKFKIEGETVYFGEEKLSPELSEKYKSLLSSYLDEGEGVYFISLSPNETSVRRERKK